MPKSNKDITQCAVEACNAGTFAQQQLAKANCVHYKAIQNWRKPFGYIQRTKCGVGFEILCKRFNHSSPAVTMRYLGIEDAEVLEILTHEI